MPLIILTLVAFGWLVGSVEAQTIKAPGSAGIAKLPERMRMTVVVVGRGKDLSQALADLNRYRPEAEKKIRQLSPIAETVRWTDPQILGGQNSQGPGEPNLGDPFPPNLPPPPPVGGKRPVFVSLTLRAEWRLDSTKEEAFLHQVKALEDKILSADPGSSKRWAPGEVPCNCANGTPQFTYLAQLNPQETEEALRKAFSHAQDQARLLARACGKDLGALQNLELSHPDLALPGAGLPSEGTFTSINLNPGTTQVRVSLFATFQLRDTP